MLISPAVFRSLRAKRVLVSFHSSSSWASRFLSSSAHSVVLPAVTAFASNTNSFMSSSSSSSSSHFPSAGSTSPSAAALPLSSAPSIPPAKSSSFWMDAYWRVRSWWIPSDHSQLAESEKRILSAVHKPFQQKFVDIGDGLYINTLHFKSPAADSSAAAPSSGSSAAVLLHGYAGGVGSWVRNYDSLSTLFPSLYSIDWLGTGRSARPEWTAKGVEQSEAFFAESLEKWRKANGISSLELVGHSMGGYLASAYTLRYPQNVSRLILLSPVGMPRKDPEANERWKQLSLTRRMIFGSIRWLMTAGVTPNDVVKFIGPWGRRPVAGYFNNRFRLADTEAEDSQPSGDGVYVPEFDKDLQSNYHYHNLALERSGDAVLSQVLGENVFAHQPMIDRLPSVVVQHNIPTHFVYGSSDWMDVRCGKLMAQMIAEGQQQSLRTKAAGASFHVVNDAGHQLFIENPQGVYEAIKEIVRIPAKRNSVSK